MHLPISVSFSLSLNSKKEGKQSNSKTHLYTLTNQIGWMAPNTQNLD